MDISLLEQRYKISTYLTNFQGKLGLYHLLNLLQDSASEHADHLGFGREEMLKTQKFWVLARQKLVMKSWPCWHDEVVIKTWIRLQSGPFSSRDFSIHLGEEQIGECTTSWVCLDAKSRRPVAYDRSKILEKLTDHGKVSIETNKIPPLSQVESLTRFQVRNSDIDHNMHVNNTKYAQWILDAIPLDRHLKSRLLSYEVNFILETKLGDMIIIQRGETSEGIQYQGFREADNKIVFTAIVKKEAE